MNKEIQKRLGKINSEIIKDKGNSTFFGAFLNPEIFKDNGQERWDLIFSAPWFKEGGTRKDYEYVFGKVIKNFDPDQLSTFLEKLYLVDVRDPVIKALNKKVGSVEDRMLSFEPLQIKVSKDSIEIPKAIVFSSTFITKKGKAKIKTVQPGANKDFPKSKGTEEGEIPDALGKIAPKRHGH